MSRLTEGGRRDDADLTAPALDVGIGRGMVLASFISLNESFGGDLTYLGGGKRSSSLSGDALARRGLGPAGRANVSGLVGEGRLSYASSLSASPNGRMGSLVDLGSADFLRTPDSSRRVPNRSSTAMPSGLRIFLVVSAVNCNRNLRSQ